MKIENDTIALEMAVKVVSAALQSNAITLLGPKSDSFAKANAETDAQYLNILITSIATRIYSGK